MYKFKSPVTHAELRDDAWLWKEWGSLRSSFQGKVHELQPNVWTYLMREAKRREGRTFRRTLERCRTRLPRQHHERDYEDKLGASPRLLSRIRSGLALWASADLQTTGRQYLCEGPQCRIDLLCVTPGNRSYVVIELKSVTATAQTFGQISAYMGWVKRHLAHKKPVHGCIIAPDSDAGLDLCLATTSLIRFRKLDDFGLT
jgi:hypothetical protein